MINKNFFFKNNIPPRNIKDNSINSLSKKFDKIFLEIKADIKNSNKTLNVLNKDYKFNLKIKFIIFI